MNIKSLFDNLFDESKTYDIFRMKTYTGYLIIGSFIPIVLLGISLWFLLSYIGMLIGVMILKHIFWRCPSCEIVLPGRGIESKKDYCPKCGDKLDKVLTEKQIAPYRSEAFTVGGWVYGIVLIIAIAFGIGGQIEANRESILNEQVISSLQTNEAYEPYIEAYIERDYGKRLRSSTENENDFTAHIWTEDGIMTLRIETLGRKEIGRIEVIITDHEEQYVSGEVFNEQKWD